jgi:predicted short-subunit dehydrogenase-like oxidoreductase (DUF2520 family)
MRSFVARRYRAYCSEVAMTNTSSLAPRGVTIIGAGRLGRALAAALASARIAVVGPLRRGEWEETVAPNDIVLLCVPDGEIARVARAIAVDAIVGHCAGAMTLDALSPHRGFSLHPLLAITGESTRFDGAAAAIAGTDADTLAMARELTLRLGMTPITIADADRTLYHASAVAASNYLVALEETAATLGARVGLERRPRARLAETARENWARDGAASLTGPVVRGDEAVVMRQRDEIARVFPRLVPFWDALTERTRDLAADSRR